MSDPSSDGIIYNGEFYRAGSPVLTVSTRGLRYGDGLFETLLVQNGRIRLRDFHFDRLWNGMRRLMFEPPADLTAENLTRQIMDLCLKNGHSSLGRVRLMVFRGEGSLFDAARGPLNYVIESTLLTPGQIAFNESGLRVGVYRDLRKSRDFLANLKSNNFLLYTMAARYVRDQGWDDCLVLNDSERVADSCMANLFYIRKGTVYTPPLSEGCVAGVMRRFLLERMPCWGFTVREQPVSVGELGGAAEIFLTNAVRTIRWVGEFAGRTYRQQLARELYELAVKEA